MACHTFGTFQERKSIVLTSVIILWIKLNFVITTTTASSWTLSAMCVVKDEIVQFVRCNCVDLRDNVLREISLVGFLVGMKLLANNNGVAILVPFSLLRTVCSICAVCSIVLVPFSNALLAGPRTMSLVGKSFTHSRCWNWGRWVSQPWISAIPSSPVSVDEPLCEHLAPGRSGYSASCCEVWVVAILRETIGVLTRNPGVRCASLMRLAFISTTVDQTCLKLVNFRLPEQSVALLETVLVEPSKLEYFLFGGRSSEPLKPLIKKCRLQDWYRVKNLEWIWSRTRRRIVGWDSFHDTYELRTVEVNWRESKVATHCAFVVNIDHDMKKKSGPWSTVRKICLRICPPPN